MSYKVFYPVKDTSKVSFGKDEIVCNTNINEPIFAVIPGQVMSVGGSFRTSDIEHNRHIIENMPDVTNDLTGDLSRIENFSSDRNMFLRNYILMQHFSNEEGKNEFMYSVYMNMLTIDVLPGDWIESGTYLGTSGTLRDIRDKQGQFIEHMMSLGHFSNQDLGKTHIFFINENKYQDPKEVMSKKVMPKIIEYDKAQAWADVLAERVRKVNEELKERYEKLKAMFTSNDAEASGEGGSGPGGAAIRNAIIAEAEKQFELGEQGKIVYSMGNRGKGSKDSVYYTDCSLFSHECYKAAGVEGGMGTTTHTMVAYLNSGKGKKLSREEMEVGDLILWREHVGIYYGDGIMIHTGSTRGAGVNDIRKQELAAYDNWRNNSRNDYVTVFRTDELVEADKNTGGGVGANGEITTDLSAYGFEQKWINIAQDSMLGGGNRCATTIQRMNSNGWKQFVINHSQAGSVDPYWILAKIAVESTGDHRNNTGNYIGLMQIKREGGTLDPSRNIQIGIGHYHNMSGYTRDIGMSFESHPLIGWVAYNSGQATIERGLKTAGLTTAQANNMRLGEFLPHVAEDGVRRWGTGKREEINTHVIKQIIAYDYFTKNNSLGI